MTLSYLNVYIASAFRLPIGTTWGPFMDNIDMNLHRPVKCNAPPPNHTQQSTLKIAKFCFHCRFESLNLSFHLFSL